MSYQHYVPAFYLKRFTDPSSPVAQTPYVWVCKQKGDPRRKAPHKIAGQPGYYLAKDRSGKPSEIIEQTFSRLETRVAPVLERIDREDLDLSPDDRDVFAEFLLTLNFRVPKFRQLRSTFSLNVTRWMLHMTASMPDDALQGWLHAFARNTGHQLAPDEFRRLVEQDWDKFDYSLSNPQETAIGWMLQIFDRLPELIALIRNLDWVWLRAPHGEAFITSDAPVSLSDPTLPSHWRAAAFASPGLELILPISPRIAFCGNRRGVQGLVSCSGPMLSEVNCRTTLEGATEVYSSRKLDENPWITSYRWRGRVRERQSETHGPSVFPEHLDATTP